jgi:hypothetical protein
MFRTFISDEISLEKGVKVWAIAGLRAFDGITTKSFGQNNFTFYLIFMELDLFYILLGYSTIVGT